MSIDTIRAPARNCLVTGAGSGVGRAIAKALARVVGPVALVGRRRANLEETARLIAEAGGSAATFVFPADVTDPEAVADLFAYLKTQGAMPEVLVNCAGVNGRFTGIDESDPEDWTTTIKVNLIAPYLMTRAALPHMQTIGWGRIVNVSSAASLGISHVNSAYSLSKVALNHFTRQTAQQVMDTEISATAIHPGEVKTEMWEAIRKDSAGRGETGAGGRTWAAMVDETGGDPPEKAAALMLRIVQSPAAAVNDRFLWIEDGIKKPCEVW